MTESEITVTKIDGEWYCLVDDIMGMISHPKGAFDNMLDFLFHLRGAKENEIIELDGAKYAKFADEWWTCIHDICDKKDTKKWNAYLKAIEKKEMTTNANS